MPIPRLGGEPGHSGADEVRHTLSLLRVAGSDVVPDHALCGQVEGEGCLASLIIVAAGAFQNKAPGGGRIGGVAAGGLLQHGCETLGDGAVGAQDVVEGNSRGICPAIENPHVEAGFVAKTA